MSFDFPFVRLFGVRSFCYYPYSILPLSMIFLFDFGTTPFFTLLFEEYLTSYICDRYLVCLPGSPTTTNPGIGPELSMMTPLDVALLHRSAPLQLITVEKYLTP